VKRNPVIAVDFDGTLVESRFPGIGPDLGAVPWLRQAQALGARLVLWTCRYGTARYVDARAWCGEHGLAFDLDMVELDDIDRLRIGKVRAELYIDDHALGVPLRSDANGRPAVDWELAGPMLLERIGGA